MQTNLGWLTPDRRHAAIRIVAAIAFAIALVHGTDRETEPGEVFFCVSLALAFAAALIFLTRRIALALLLSAGVILALRTISLIKQNYLDQPLFAPDLLYFGNGDTLDVVAHYPEIWHALVPRALL